MKTATADNSVWKRKTCPRPPERQNIKWKNPARIETVEKFARLKLRIQPLTSSTFEQSWLVMTWSVALAGLSRAGAKSEPQYYKKVQEVKDHQKTWVLSDNHFNISDKEKKTKIVLLILQNNPVENKGLEISNKQGSGKQEEKNE